MIRCKAKNRGNGKRCKDKAVIEEYCIKHFKMYYDFKKKKRKR